MAPKKPNPQDTTLRNLRATKKREAALLTRVADLEACVAELEAGRLALLKRVAALEALHG